MSHFTNNPHEAPPIRQQSNQYSSSASPDERHATMFPPTTTAPPTPPTNPWLAEGGRPFAAETEKMERALFNLHHQMCSFVVRCSSSQLRSWMERFLLVLAVCGFGALLLAHITFVHRHPAAQPHSTAPQQSAMTIPAKCLAGIPGFTATANVTHVYVVMMDDPPQQHPTQTQLHHSHSGKSFAFTQWPQANTRYNATTDGFESTCMDDPDGLLASSFPTSAAVIHQLSYSRVKGMLLLSSSSSPNGRDLAQEHRISVQHVFVSNDDLNCFGEPFLSRLVFGLMGVEKVALNWILAFHDSIPLLLQQQEQEEEDSDVMASTGFVYNPQTDALMELEPSAYYHAPSYHDPRHHLSYSKRRRRNAHLHDKYHYSARARWSYFYGIQLAGSKLSVLLKTCFLYFITTTLVSFTLRETQERMLDFTQELQRHVRNRRPVAVLVTRHFVDNLVFVPIMVGMIFFLIEFYDGDKILAFLVLSIVWMVEVFAAVSVRSFAGVHFFPKIFFLLFCVLHFYIFSFPYGFSYTALCSTVCFMMHSMLFFFHRFELPAVVLGQVTADRPRNYHHHEQRIGGIPEGSIHHHHHIQSQHSADDTVAGSLSRSAGQGANYSQVVDHISNPPAAPLLQPPHRTAPMVATSASSRTNMSRRSSRHSLQRIPSYSTASSHGGVGLSISRQTSATGLFHHGDFEDDGSFLFMLGGEVVMHRPRGGDNSSINNNSVRQAPQQQSTPPQRPVAQPHPSSLPPMQHASPVPPQQLAAGDPLLVSPLATGSAQSRMRASGAHGEEPVQHMALDDTGYVPLPPLNDLPPSQQEPADDLFSSEPREPKGKHEAGKSKKVPPPLVTEEGDFDGTTPPATSNSHETPVRDNRGEFISPDDARVSRAPRFPNGRAPTEEHSSSLRS